MKHLFTVATIQIWSIFLIIVGIAWPYLNQPAHWDETSYLDGVRKIYEAGGNPFVEFWSYKPPLHFEIGAVVWSLFGIGRWQLRLVTAVELAVMLYVFKHLIKYLFYLSHDSSSRVPPWYWWVGSWGLVVLLATNSVVAGQAFLYQPEILLTVLWMVAVYLYLHQKWNWYWLSTSLLLLVKESAVISFSAIVLIEVAVTLSSVENNWVKIKRFATVVSPIVWLVAWLIGNKAVFGWWLWPYNIHFFSANKPYDAAAITKILGMFVDNQLWLTSLIALFVLFFLMRRWLSGVTTAKKQRAYILLAILGVAGFGQVVFALFGAFIPRYVLSIYPTLLVVVAIGYAYLGKLNQYGQALGLLFLSIGIGMQVSWLVYSNQTGRFDGWALDQDWRYMRTVRQYQGLQKWWQDTFPEYTLFGDWLAWTYFIDPLYGYVENEKAVQKFVSCEQVANNHQPFLLMTGIGFTAQENQAVLDCAAQLHLRPLAEFSPIVVYTATDAE